MTMRVSATDWVEGGGTSSRTIEFARALEQRGCAAIHVSSGGLDPRQEIPVGPSYQVPLAREVKCAVCMPVVAVGLITDFEQAEAIIGTGDADMVALARGILYDPRWPWHAAARLGAQVKGPVQYLRSQPRQHRDLFDWGNDMNGALLSLILALIGGALWRFRRRRMHCSAKHPVPRS